MREVILFSRKKQDLFVDKKTQIHDSSEQYAPIFSFQRTLRATLFASFISPISCDHAPESPSKKAISAINIPVSETVQPLLERPVINPLPFCNRDKVHLILSNEEIPKFAKMTYLLRDDGNLFKDEKNMEKFPAAHNNMSRQELHFLFSTPHLRARFFQGMPTTEFENGIQQMREKYLDSHTFYGNYTFPYALENFKRIFLEKNQECSQQFLEIQRNAEFHKEVVQILQGVKTNPEKWFQGKFDPVPYIDFSLDPTNNVIFVSTNDIGHQVRRTKGYKGIIFPLSFGNNFYRLVCLENPQKISVLFEELYHATTIRDVDMSNDVERGKEEIISAFFGNTLANILQEPDESRYHTLRTNASNVLLTPERIGEIIDDVHKNVIINLKKGTILKSLVGMNPCPLTKRDWIYSLPQKWLPFFSGKSMQSGAEECQYSQEFINTLTQFYQEKMKELGILP